MKREPFIAHSELTNEIYIVAGKEKYRVTEQAIKAVKAIEALEQEPCEDVISREPFTDSTICEGFSCDECSFNRKDKGGCILEERVMNLPSAKQEPKTIQEMQAESEKYKKAFEDGYEQGYAQARFDYEQEPCEDTQERYEDLCEYFGDAKDILKSRKDFKAWLERIKWHIRKAEELYEKYEESEVEK